VLPPKVGMDRGEVTVRLATDRACGSVALSVEVGRLRKLAERFSL